MRRGLAAVMTLVLAASSAATASAQGPDLEGRWKLLVLPYGDDEFVVVEVKAPEGQPTAKLLNSQAFLGKAEVESIKAADGALVLALNVDGGTSAFTGVLPDDAAKKGPILGTFVFRGTTYPARLEPTEADKVKPLTQGDNPLMNSMRQAMQGPDPKAAAAKLREVINANRDKPNIYHGYDALLGMAERAELSPEEVKALVGQYIADAAAYGPAWVAESRSKALRAISGKKPFAPLGLELARAADKELPADASAEQKATVVGLLARAAELAGDAALAASAKERLVKLESVLDEEYLKKVPPFAPAAYAGRKQADADSLVVMELFTGAQCPPCVAADVAFDALLKTYQPTELIGLQYHLHIPGPDPLTNKDTEARAEYYRVNSTPSTFFNGKPDARGGGSMGASEQKYQQYRGIIDKQLEDKKRGSIDLQVAREGQTLKLTINAQATPAKAEGEANSDESKLRVRVVLTEESVRYVGGNRLRFHHHVVRAVVPNVEGLPLTNGRLRQELTVDLDQVAEGIQTYLSDFAKNATFANTPPSVDWKDLSVVAFIQDDTDKSILHAVSVPAGGEEKPAE